MANSPDTVDLADTTDASEVRGAGGAGTASKRAQLDAAAMTLRASLVVRPTWERELDAREQEVDARERGEPPAE